MGVQQPAQGGLAGVAVFAPDPPPGQIQGAAGPGQGHIDQAQVLGQALALGQAQVGLEVVGAGVQAGPRSP